MALVEIAKFLDLTEAQAAAAALRASGVPVFMQNENWGQTEPYLQLAMGGFRLWTPEEEAEDARAFLATAHADPLPTEPGHGDAALTLMAALGVLLTPALGWMVAPFARRRLIDEGEPPRG